MKKFRAGKFLMKLFTKEFFKTEQASQYNEGEGLSKGFTRGEWVIITTWMVKYQKDSVVCVKYGCQERLPSKAVKEYDFYWRDSKGHEYSNGITDWQPINIKK